MGISIYAAIILCLFASCLWLSILHSARLRKKPHLWPHLYWKRTWIDSSVYGSLVQMGYLSNSSSQTNQRSVLVLKTNVWWMWLFHLSPVCWLIWKFPRFPRAGNWQSISKTPGVTDITLDSTGSRCSRNLENRQKSLRYLKARTNKCQGEGGKANVK